MNAVVTACYPASNPHPSSTQNPFFREPSHRSSQPQHLPFTAECKHLWESGSASGKKKKKSAKAKSEDVISILTHNPITSSSSRSPPSIPLSLFH
ncbi:hypothetical protein VTK26DRAFT_327 [Humicola hyalothermophila]